MSGDALIALVGVGFGAVVTYLARLFLELRRERAETRAGFRLVRSDLADAGRAVEDALAKEVWPTGTRKTWLDTWRQYRPGLASYLTELEFRKVARAYARMDELESGLNAPRNDWDKSFTIPAGDEHMNLDVAEKEKDLKRRRRDARFLADMQDLIRPALQTLEACPEPSLHLWSRHRRSSANTASD